MNGSEPEFKVNSEPELQVNSEPEFGVNSEHGAARDAAPGDSGAPLYTVHETGTCAAACLRGLGLGLARSLPRNTDGEPLEPVSEQSGNLSSMIFFLLSLGDYFF